MPKSTSSAAMVLRSVFSFDFRSMALARILISIIILLDLFVRACSLSAHYTDDGTLPRSVSMYLVSDQWFYSLHNIGGNFWIEALLFVMAAVCALSLMVGYRTRLMSVLSWVFLISVQNRNFLVLNGGDVLFRQLLFWGMFLPWGARYSVDHALSESKDHSAGAAGAVGETFFSASTIALIVQIICVYTFSGLLKEENEIWRAGLGLYYSFSPGIYSNAWGQKIPQFYDTLKQLTPLTLYFEIFGPMIALIPWKNWIFRLIAIVKFWGFHLVNFIFLEVGFFSPLGMTAWSFLLPTQFWRSIVKPWPDIQFYYDQECSVCIKMVKIFTEFLAIPVDRARPAQSDPKIHKLMDDHGSWVVAADGRHYFEFEGVLRVISGRWPGRWVAVVFKLPPFFQLGTFAYRAFADHRPEAAHFFPESHPRRLIYGTSWPTQIVASGLCTLILLWNLATLHPPRVRLSSLLRSIGFATRIDQGWAMFSSAFRDDGYFVIPAMLRDQTKIDLFKNLFKSQGEGGPLDWKRPEVVSETFSSDRWRKYMISLYQDRHDDRLQEFGRYLCRRWNSTHDDAHAVDHLDVDYIHEDILPEGGRAPPAKVILWSHRCF